MPPPRRLFPALLLFTSLDVSHAADDSEWQPSVTIIESHPATRVFGGLNMPAGSPWCDGRRMVWWVGHQEENESPTCQVSPGVWQVRSDVVMDVQDRLNAKDGNRDSIDRHQCVSLDVNHDGRLDIICGVGADKGQGEGYNELYLTRENGTLKKILTKHGLHKYPSLRNRIAVVVKGRMGEQYVFLGVKGINGSEENVHRMFLNVYKRRNKFPWFREVHGPWQIPFQATFAVAAPLRPRQDYDGLVIGNIHGRALIIEQGRKRFRQVSLDNKPLTRLWRSGRVSDINQDGVPDSVVTTFGKGATSMLYIFRGVAGTRTIFNFDDPMFSMKLPYAAPDVELAYTSARTWPNIYVVQVDESQGYCRVLPSSDMWGGSPYPPKDWVPPLDEVRDLLLVPDTLDVYKAVPLDHSLPGCGYLVQSFGNHSLVLAQGDTAHYGYNLLLEWA